MYIMGNGINYSTGKPLVESLDEGVFAEKIKQTLSKRGAEVAGLARFSTTATTFRGEIERERTLDLGDARVAGWTFLVNDKDPKRNQIIDALHPLAEHRGMDDPKSPMLFTGLQPDEWYDWLQDYYFALSLEGKKVPHYIVIVGDPKQVPFHFQSMLDSAASVGRLDFESIGDLKKYVEKVIRLEKTAAPVVTRDAIMFATDHGPRDATHFSRLYMAEPLADHIKTKYGLNIHSIIGPDATKANLLEYLNKINPAIVYTASHGIAAPAESIDVQKQYNGAIVCQHAAEEAVLQWLFAAADVPSDKPFLEGSVFFQFACFGAGTPSESDFMHWLGDPELNAAEDFVAALPKKLLAHPRGPIAYIGHMDTAWLHGFDDPESPHLIERWHLRITPFVSAVDTLLRVQPAGMAMAGMNKRYDLTNAQLTNFFDRMQRGKIKFTPELAARLADTYIFRSDAQNYLIIGDPAARVRIPAA